MYNLKLIGVSMKLVKYALSGIALSASLIFFVSSSDNKIETGKYYESIVGKLQDELSFKRGLPVVLHNYYGLEQTIGRLRFNINNSNIRISDMHELDKKIIEEDLNARGGKHYDGADIDEHHLDSFNRTGAILLNEKSQYACFVFGSKDFINDLYSKKTLKGNLDWNTFILIHELSHCELISQAGIYNDLERRFPGLKLFKSIDEKDNRYIAKRVYKEHIYEVYSDIRTLMYVYFEGDVSEGEFMDFAKLISDKRNYKKEDITSVSFGHYTYQYVSPIRNDYRNLDVYRSLYQKSPTQAVLKYMMDRGSDYSIGYESFLQKVATNF